MEDYKIHKIFSELTEKVVKCFQYFRITDIPHKTGLNGKSIKLKGRMHVCSTLSNKYNPDTIFRTIYILPANSRRRFFAEYLSVPINYH